MSWQFNDQNVDFFQSYDDFIDSQRQSTGIRTFQFQPFSNQTPSQFVLPEQANDFPIKSKKIVFVSILKGCENKPLVKAVFNVGGTTLEEAKRMIKNDCKDFLNDEDDFLLQYFQDKDEFSILNETAWKFFLSNSELPQLYAKVQFPSTNNKKSNQKRQNNEGKAIESPGKKQKTTSSDSHTIPVIDVKEKRSPTVEENINIPSCINENLAKLRAANLTSKLFNSSQYQLLYEVTINRRYT